MYHHPGPARRAIRQENKREGEKNCSLIPGKRIKRFGVAGQATFLVPDRSDIPNAVNNIPEDHSILFSTGAGGIPAIFCSGEYSS
jgi:hypothetical protein